MKQHVWSHRNLLRFTFYLGDTLATGGRQPKRQRWISAGRNANANYHRGLLKAAEL